MQTPGFPNFVAGDNVDVDLVLVARQDPSAL